MELMDEDDARTQIKAYADSRDWWIVHRLSSQTGRVLSMIEERHYAGPANADFHILMGGMLGSIFSVAFAHKRRMSPRQLGRIMREVGDPRKLTDLSASLKTQDVLLVVDEDDPAPCITLAYAFNEWVYGKQVNDDGDHVWTDPTSPA